MGYSGCNIESLWFLLASSVREGSRFIKSHTLVALDFIFGFSQHVYYLKSLITTDGPKLLGASEYEILVAVFLGLVHLSPSW